MNRYNNFIEAVTNKAAMKYMLTEDNNSFINLQKKVNCSFMGKLCFSKSSSLSLPDISFLFFSPPN
jgi:hypothetical protein